MRILLLSDFALEGETAQVFALGRALTELGHRVHLLMTFFPPRYRAGYQKFLDNLGFEVTLNPEPEEVIALAAAEGFDILHAHSFGTYETAARLSREFGAPFVLSFYSPEAGAGTPREFLQGAARLICPDAGLAEGLGGFREKTDVIPQGVDTRELAPGKKGLPVKILYAGRVGQHNRRSFQAFEKSLGLCHATSLDFHYVCAANTNSGFPGARSLGWLPSLAPHAGSTDIIVGTGRTLLEGMAAGNAACILGSHWGGVVTPGKAARPEGLDLSGREGKEPCYRNIFFDLAKLIKNTRYLRELQQFSRAHIQKRHDLKIAARQLEEVYASALASG